MSIEECAQEVWSYFKSIDTKAYGIIDQSIPILYLGDYNAYKKSRIKIITMGLNPSNKEFPDDNAFSRFYQAEKIYDLKSLNQKDAGVYLDSLNIYFEHNSNDWFANYEPILNAMNASFYPGYENTVLHTDLYSPLVINDSWSKYQKNTSPSIVDGLIQKGSELWHRLADILQPDIILTSVGESNSTEILNGQEIPWTCFEVFDETSEGKKRKKPFEVHCAIANLNSGKKCLIVSGMNNVIPFMITQEQKAMLGKNLYNLIKGNRSKQSEAEMIGKNKSSTLFTMIHDSKKKPEVFQL